MVRPLKNFVSREILTAKNIPVEISFHKQRSSTARIREGRLILRISRFLSREDRETHIDQLIRKMSLAKSRIRISPWEFLKYPGANTLLLATGQTYEVHIKAHEKMTYGIHKIGSTLFILKPVTDLVIDGKKVDHVLWNFLMKDQVPVLKKKLDRLAEGWIFERCSRIRLRLALSRWGSCDKKTAVIMLSPKLLLLPEKLLDYVCIHELAHLKYSDHSDLFWDLISQKMPDWKVQRKKLRHYE